MPTEPWWREADAAARLLTSTLDAAVFRARRDGVYHPPPGTRTPVRRRRAGSLRHLAEVIQTHRLAPGIAVDKDIVGRVLNGDPRYLTEPTVVVAVAHAACLIAAMPFTDDDARRLTAACAYVDTLIRAAREADRRAPALVPAARAASDSPPPVTAVPATASRRARNVTAELLAVVLVLAVIGMTVVLSRTHAASEPADPTLGAVNPNCSGSAPPPGSDLLDVPHAHPPGDARMDDWWPNDSHIERGPYGLREFQVTVRSGRPNIWDLVIFRSCLPVVAGRQYRLTLTARSDRPATVRVRVQEPEGAVMSYSTDLHLGPIPQRLDTSLTARSTSRQNELMFQVGGNPVDYHLRVSDISLTG